MRWCYALSVVLLAGCRRQPPVVEAAPAPFVLQPMETDVEPIAPAEPLPRPPRRLKLVAKGERCSVIDEDTGVVVGRATSRDTAAGGSEVECVDFELEGRVILFMNSRGLYAKDARPGKTNNMSLPCGAGRWASDMSSCIQVDTSPFAYSGADEKEDAPFHVAMCPLERGREAECPVIATIRRGLNRAPYSSERLWDAAYCDEHTAVVVANGELRLVAAPSGKLLARQPTPRMTGVGCSNGEATVSGGGAKQRFRVSGNTLAKVES